MFVTPFPFQQYFSTSLIQSGCLTHIITLLHFVFSMFFLYPSSSRELMEKVWLEMLGFAVRMRSCIFLFSLSIWQFGLIPEVNGNPKQLIFAWYFLFLDLLQFLQWENVDENELLICFIFFKCFSCLCNKECGTSTWSMMDRRFNFSGFCQIFIEDRRFTQIKQQRKSHFFQLQISIQLMLEDLPNLISLFSLKFYFLIKIQLMHNYNVLNRFATKTRVGNWYEEAELNDFKFKEYLYNKNTGHNETLNTKSKLSFSNQNKELTPFNEGKVSFGDYVCLGNDCTEAVLAFNVNEILSGEDTYAVTTSKNLQPSLRNVFQVCPTKQVEGQTLRYGDKIRFQSKNGEKKLYLQSVAVSPMRSSKFSKFQEVSVTADLNSSTIWVVEHSDPAKRTDAKGEEVAAGQPILIKHCLTGQWLGSDKITYMNDFGSEFEVFGKSMLTNNKTQNLFSEKVGHKSVENALRNQDCRNSWRILKGK